MIKSGVWLILCGVPALGHGFTIVLDSDDFGVTPVFSSVTGFDFRIEIDEPLMAGAVYMNPTISSVNYTIGGALASTPSGFPSFLLQRTITGTDFYNQGSSLSFSIDAGADLSDGLQISELSGVGEVFRFDAREVETGRYHPSLVTLNDDGTGRVQNSNNSSPTTPNPQSMQTFTLDFGDEYISDLTFAGGTTIAVPEPSAACLGCLAFLAALRLRRRI